MKPIRHSTHDLKIAQGEHHKTVQGRLQKSENSEDGEDSPKPVRSVNEFT